MSNLTVMSVCPADVDAENPDVLDQQARDTAMELAAERGVTLVGLPNVSVRRHGPLGINSGSIDLVENGMVAREFTYRTEPMSEVEASLRETWSA